EVGGDLYDFFILDEKLYFTIGDVSGKGVPASLFMAVTRTLFRNISRSTLTSEEIVGQMNESMTQQNDSNMFVTLFVGILDLQNGKLDYCNAGHNPPVLVASDGTTTLLKPKKSQLAVGVFNETVYTSESITLESGTKLFCYTDGIVEAENVGKRLYRQDRLMQTLSLHHQCDVKRLTEQVLESVAGHVLDAEQSDDLTVLVIKYKK
ncbi:MAG: PP2C family protein-serine/threonine phosphatase, partial [Mucinivorans sp.]